MTNLFTKSELDAYNAFKANLEYEQKTYKGETFECIKKEDLEKFVELELAFLRHRAACKLVGVVGVGCFNTYQK
jgi:hypothetical protein